MEKKKEIYIPGGLEKWDNLVIAVILFIKCPKTEKGTLFSLILLR